jgi:hypothetical protein
MRLCRARRLALLVYEATSVCGGLKILVYEATSVCGGLKILVYEALSYKCMRP